ncbi:2OG-Fe(II) oxygenase [Pedobacter cryotolerans]|uniref:2OG-Fe(II) oxygenase n=1 Tax=Pedobacter cryotolerans TaxID=2571270 RepID=A0A4U1CBU7_9SPHI|nr:2OG-Fe(II) oxygenase [Pedobacter cryotolerans]TKC01260.1 2OG-Fe(II) oxygenase [Pedobacter cryotolerans]
MEKIFNAIIDSFIVNKVGIADNFLTENLAQSLKQNLVKLFQTNLMLAAGTGNHTIVNHDKLIRSDIIYWLDRSHNDQHENAFFDLMDAFVLHLNATCYTGITNYEFHYTLYEKGSFYKKHIDQFQANGSRAYSMVMYLNQNWKQIDGGELRIHHLDSQQNISPLNGKSIFFKSNELAHEVLITNEPRMSITGWLKTN